MELISRAATDVKYLQYLGMEFYRIYEFKFTLCNSIFQRNMDLLKFSGTQTSFSDFLSHKQKRPEAKAAWVIGCAFLTGCLVLEMKFLGQCIAHRLSAKGPKSFLVYGSAKWGLGDIGKLPINVANFCNSLSRFFRAG